MVNRDTDDEVSGYEGGGGLDGTTKPKLAGDDCTDGSSSCEGSLGEVAAADSDSEADDVVAEAKQELLAASDMILRQEAEAQVVAGELGSAEPEQAGPAAAAAEAAQNDDTSIYDSYVKYDDYVTDVVGPRKPVMYNGQCIGELQPMSNASGLYTCAARCKIGGHRQCSRMRTYKVSMGEPVDHVDRVLVKLLIGGCQPGVNSKETRTVVKRFPRECC